jgi:predicted O-methyltransferase YrrM
MKTAKKNLAELAAVHRESGARFQDALGQFVVDRGLNTLVETGSGITTLRLAAALDARGIGALYSIDPTPACGFELEHPRCRLIKRKSFQALAPLYLETGPWDFFLHDSDHWIECQTFEYAFAYACLKKGGWIFSDDYEWDGHFAWRNFVAANGLKEIRVGDIMGARKEADWVLDAGGAPEFAASLWERSLRDGADWRAANGRPPCWTGGSDTRDCYRANLHAADPRPPQKGK